MAMLVLSQYSEVYTPIMDSFAHHFESKIEDSPLTWNTTGYFQSDRPAQSPAHWSRT